MQTLDPKQIIDAPHTPPGHWFTEIPDWYDPNHSLIQIKLDGPEAGRVAALVAPWGECVLDGKEGCFTAPQSPTGYEFAHVGTTITAEGDQVRTANVGGNVDHAPHNWSMSPAVSHYANTATRMMRGRYIDGPNGVIFLGAMWPGTTIADALEAIASALSGDWRWVQTLRAYDMAGSQLVNNPGFRPNPLNTNYAITASMAPAPTDDNPYGLPTVIYGNWEPAPKPSPFTTAKRIKETALNQHIQRIPVVELEEPATPEPVIGTDTDDDAVIEAVVAAVLGCNCGTGCPGCNHTGIIPHTPDHDAGYDLTELPEELLGANK